MNCVECGSATILVGPLRVCQFCKASFDSSGERVHSAGELTDIVAKASLEAATSMSRKGASVQEIAMVTGQVAAICNKVWMEGFKQGLLIGSLGAKAKNNDN